MATRSLNEYRLKSNPLEKRFLDKWDEQNEVGSTLEYILSNQPGERKPVTFRDAEVAATVIQWLGSPIGQAFVEDVLGINDLRLQIPGELLGE